MGFEIWMTSCNWNKLKHSSQCCFNALFLPLFVYACVLIRKIKSQQLTIKWTKREAERRREVEKRNKITNHWVALSVCVCVRTQILATYEYWTWACFQFILCSFPFFAVLFIVICSVRIWTQRHHNIVYKKQQKKLTHPFVVCPRVCFINSVVAFNFLVNTVCHNITRSVPMTICWNITIMKF